MPETSRPVRPTSNSSRGVRKAARLLTDDDDNHITNVQALSDVDLIDIRRLEAEDSKWFETELRKQMIGLRDSLTVAQEKGLTFEDLFFLYRRHSARAYSYNALLDEWKERAPELKRYAKALRDAAAALRAMQILVLPFAASLASLDESPRRPQEALASPFREVPGDGRRRGGIGEGAGEPVAGFFLTGVRAEDDGVEWLPALLMPAEIVDMFTLIAPSRGPIPITEEQLATVKTPWARDFLLAATRDPLERKIDQLRRDRGFNMQRRVNAGPLEIRAFAALIDDLAGQVEQIFGVVRRAKGRPGRRDERCFRVEFADLAMARSGEYLDAIGAAMFSVMFSSIEPRDYGRRRRCDAAARSRVTTPRRKNSPASGRRKKPARR
jgi:hypothetical protein